MTVCRKKRSQLVSRARARSRERGHLQLDARNGESEDASRRCRPYCFPAYNVSRWMTRYFVSRGFARKKDRSKFPGICCRGSFTCYDGTRREIARAVSSCSFDYYCNRRRDVSSMRYALSRKEKYRGLFAHRCDSFESFYATFASTAIERFIVRTRSRETPPSPNCLLDYYCGYVTIGNGESPLKVNIPA